MDVRSSALLSTTTTINGERLVAQHPPEASALEIVREHAGLTGAKLVCGAGVCGACTVLLDERPVTACTLPATALEGRAVRTVEAYGPQSLHPVQRAFLACDALQCGYCTPGFVVEAIAFHDRWRASREATQGGDGSDRQGEEAPSDEEIAEALAGHLCRCGAYTGIREALRRACGGEFDADETPVPPRHEALDKVTGRARYTTDVAYEGMLVAKLLGSPHAHARVGEIDTSAARAVPGVRAIVELLDDPHRVVRHVGQPILAVAADDAASAARGIEALRVDYEVRPFVSSMAAALADDAPLVYPERKKDPPNASEGPIPPDTWDGNLRTPRVNMVLSKRGGRARRAVADVGGGIARETALPDNDAESGGRGGGTGGDGHDDTGEGARGRSRRGGHATTVDADHGTAPVDIRRDAGGGLRVALDCAMPAQTHTALEPHCCVARWEGDEDRLVVHASTQSVFVLARAIARRWKLDPANVTVHAEHVGGAFGAKQGLGVEHRAAIALAREAGAPVKLVYDRAEEMTIGGCRPETRVRFALATDAERRPLGMECVAHGNPGTAVQSQVAPWIRFTYKGPKRCEDFDVVTNTGPARPMRAPGGPAAFFAMESGVDAAARALGVDPIALRRGWDASDVRASLYDWIESIPEWRDRARAERPGGRFRHGVGVAIGNWFNAFHNATRVRLAADSDGLVAECAVQDMGQGARSVIARAVADALGVPFHAVTVRIGRSDLVEGPISSASRTTASLYPAALDAAARLERAIIGRCRDELGLDEPRWEAGGVVHAGGRLELAELLERLPPTEAVSARRGGNGAFDLLGKIPSGEVGLSLMPKMTGAIALVALDVDTRLGRVLPRKVWMGLAAGRIVNRELADSQVQGAVVQSLGFALTEERRHDPHTATLLSAGLEDYRIPGLAETPEIEIRYEEGGFEGMRGGACGLSELCALPVAAALGNAVADASGWRPTALPLAPERLLAGLRAAGVGEDEGGGGGDARPARDGVVPVPEATA